MTRTDTEAPAPARRRPRVLASRTPAAMLAVVALLDVAGLVMVLSSSSVLALRQDGSSWFYFQRQLLGVVLGTAALAVGARVDYRRWRRAVRPLLAAVFVLLLAVLVPGVGIRVAGSSRWLGVGPLSFQPSELLKLAVVLFCADLLSRRATRMHDARATVAPVLVVTGLAAFLVMMQPDMGTTLVVGAAVVAVLFVSGVRLSTMGLIVGAAALGSYVVGVIEPYRRARIMSFRDPWADAANTGYQAAQSLVGLGSGHLTGTGLGDSRAKWGFLPNAHTDFIFAILGEELGLVGTVCVVGLFVAFAVLGVRTALRAPDRFGALLAAGVTAWVLSQAFLNIGAVIGLLPITGVPLPFVSYGSSALVIAMGAVGVLVNVARQARPVGAAADPAREDRT